MLRSKASPISVIARSLRRWASFHILWKIWDITVGHAEADMEEGGEDGTDTRLLLFPGYCRTFFFRLCHVPGVPAGYVTRTQLLFAFTESSKCSWA
ncbi:hypothetical protein NPIL_311821 [Nephila pilipes]|uniref:Uncharacterized protein n=1 Tax=Nephila pilipes TaxID=299642 RepID=A0A8X6NPK6_NEPPI|nr:hypothetical protein NPIL_311821 [Nephila pilipes]